VTRLVCPHCGEWQEFKLTAVTDHEVAYFCEACERHSVWARASFVEPWRVREETK
jgi:hypothetical protein